MMGSSGTHQRAVKKPGVNLDIGNFVCLSNEYTELVFCVLHLAYRFLDEYF
jgi:hypothetical protein